MKQLELMNWVWQNQRIKKSWVMLPNEQATFKSQLAAMATDSEIQNELQKRERVCFNGSGWTGKSIMTIHRRDIYFVNLNPVKGREQAGQRPVFDVKGRVGCMVNRIL